TCCEGVEVRLGRPCEEDATRLPYRASRDRNGEAARKHHPPHEGAKGDALDRTRPLRRHWGRPRGFPRCDIRLAIVRAEPPRQAVDSQLGSRSSDASSSDSGASSSYSSTSPSYSEIVGSPSRYTSTALAI